MGINYNVQNINLDNLREFENKLIIDFDNSIPYLKYLENEKNGWFFLIEKISFELFPKIMDMINKYYRDIELPFFVNKNTDIPNFMDNSDLHRIRLFDIRLDLEKRIEQLIIFGGAVKELKELNSAYTDLLEKICNYYSKLHLYQTNYAYCEIILNKEIEKEKDKRKTNNKSSINSKFISLFEGNQNLLKLSDYLNENFNPSDGRVKPTTKYNQMYFLLSNYTEEFNEKNYIVFVQECYNKNYNPSRINGLNINHQKTLKNLQLIFEKDNGISFKIL